MTTRLHMAPLLAVILWGGVYPGAKLGLQEIPVLDFTYLRILVAMVVLFVASARTQSLSLPRTLWPMVLTAGLAQTAFQLLLIASLLWTTVGNTAILLATAPLLTAAWLAATRQAVLHRQQWCGVIVGLMGVILVVWGGGFAVTWTHISGNLLALGAAAAWAWYGVVIGPLVGALGSLRATGWSMVIAAGCFTPLALGDILTQPWANVSWQAWTGLLYGATVGMVIAMSLWGKAIHRFGPQQTMLYVYLEPVSAVLIAAVLFNEEFFLLQALGALLAFAGVRLASQP